MSAVTAGPPQQLPRFFASQEEEEQQLQVACKRILVSVTAEAHKSQRSGSPCGGVCLRSAVHYDCASALDAAQE